MGRGHGLTATDLAAEGPPTSHYGFRDCHMDARGVVYEKSCARFTAVPRAANRAWSAPSMRSYGASAVLADIGSRIAPRMLPASS
jgi:hypothetical protein